MGWIDFPPFHFNYFVSTFQVHLTNLAMSTSAIDVPPKGGFSFDLCRRNDMLAKKGLKSPSYLKTGTTIVGLIFQVISCIQGVA